MEIREDREATPKTGTQALRSKRRMSVSSALRWAWSEELPKCPPPQGPSALMPGWSAMTRYSELLTTIDAPVNQYGCVPFADWSDPDPDAVLLADAVRALDDFRIDVPEGWNPASDVGSDDLAMSAVRDALERCTIVSEDGARRFRVSPTAVLISHAVNGSVPHWELEDMPRVKFVAGANGQPRWFVRRTVMTATGRFDAAGHEILKPETVEVDGMSARLHRPVVGAYRKPYLDPDPIPTICNRAEYQIFHAALNAVRDEVEGKLSTIALAPVDFAACPWVEWTAEKRPPRILQDAPRGRSKKIS